MVLLHKFNNLVYNININMDGEELDEDRLLHLLLQKSGCT